MSILDQHIRAQQLNAVLAGRSFTEMEVTRHHDTQLRIHFTDFGGHDPTGKTILSVCVEAEYLMLHLEGGYHFYWAGGETLYHASPATLPKAYGVRLAVDDGSQLTIYLPGMGGAMALANQAEYEAGKMFQTGKPRERLSALDEGRFTFEALRSLVRSANKMVCSSFDAVTDIGYLPDSLYMARINPKTKAHALSDEELRRLYEAIRRVNAEIVAQHGEALEKDVYGCPGRYKRKIAGHLSKKPCPACGTPVMKQTSSSGMGFYYCPQCQPLKS